MQVQICGVDNCIVIGSTLQGENSKEQSDRMRIGVIVAKMSEIMDVSS